jgi:hypothetical protein
MEVERSGTCKWQAMMPIHIKLQVTIGARRLSSVHRVLQASLQLVREQVGVRLHPLGQQFFSHTSVGMKLRMQGVGVEGQGNPGSQRPSAAEKIDRHITKR